MKFHRNKISFFSGIQDLMKLFKNMTGIIAVLYNINTMVYKCIKVPTPRWERGQVFPESQPPMGEGAGLS